MPEVWSVLEGDSIVAERKQVPLSLAWAVSVHKCQGMTLDRVEASLSQAFDHGMVYVALSRVKSLDGLQLRGFAPSKATAHPDVVAFYRSLGCLPPMEADRAAFLAKNASNAVLPLGLQHQQQANVSAILAVDPRAFELPHEPLKDAVPSDLRPVGADGGAEGTAGGARQGAAYEEMHEVPLETMLQAARKDPRLDRSYALASRGAYEPAPEKEMAGEGSQVERRRLGEGAADAAGSDSGKRGVHRRVEGASEGFVGKRVHEAVVAAAAQVNAARSHSSFAPPRFPPSAPHGPTAHGRHRVSGSSARVRQDADPGGGNAHGNRLNKQILEWRQGFLRSRLPASPKNNVASQANQHRATPPPHAAEADEHDLVLDLKRLQASVGGAEALEASMQASIPEAQASMPDAPEQASQVEGVMGSSLAHVQQESSLPHPGHLTSVPDMHSGGAPATKGARGSSEWRRGRTGEDVTCASHTNDQLPSSLLGDAAGGGGAWSVREAALCHKRPRHALPTSYSSATTASGLLGHGRIHEFSPASGTMSLIHGMSRI